MGTNLLYAIVVTLVETDVAHDPQLKNVKWDVLPMVTYIFVIFSFIEPYKFHSLSSDSLIVSIYLR